MMQRIIEKFNPLLFLASLGAGGIAVGGFIFIQYGGIFHGTGLAAMGDIAQTPLSIFLETVMVVFAVIHFALTILFFRGYFAWRTTAAFREYVRNPLIHSGLVTPILSTAMTFNVGIAVIRYFIPALSGNLQSLMAPALAGYVLLWVWVMATSISLLKRAFIEKFDVDKIHFGWLLQPFALAMVTVTGTGFAALAHNTPSITYNNDVAAIAAFLASVSGSMALFLFTVKLFSIFKKHLHREAALEHTFMPTYLIVVPIITLLGISVFRLGHYTSHLYEAPILFTLAKLILFGLFAFQVWYMAFGLAMIKDYWKGYLKGTFHVSQWGLICPFVAVVALGAFFSFAFFPNVLFFWFLFAIYTFTIGLFFFLLRRQFGCLAKTARGYVCDDAR